jgi:hypothetical protein
MEAIKISGMSIQILILFRILDQMMGFTSRLERRILVLMK